MPSPAQWDGTLSSTDSNYLILASWSRAIDLFNSKLTKDDKKKIDLNSRQRASFSDFLGDAVMARDKAEEGRHPWTANLRRIFSQINRYAPAGDMIVQHHAEYTSLVWGAFRFLLLFTVEEGTTSAKLSEALEYIIQIIFRAQQYAELFSVPTSSATEQIFRSLQDNLIRLYAEVLNFLVRATIFFEKPTWRRIISAGFSPYDTKFRNTLDEIDRYEKNVEKDIAVLRLAADIRQQEYENGVWLQHADFMADLQRLQELHVIGTCEWFLQSDRYTQWRQSSKSIQKSNFLWIYGKPGSGKSTLAGQIVQDMQSLPGCVVLSVFCKDGEESKNDLESLLRNLVFQLLEKSPQRRLFHQIVQAARLNAKTVRAQSAELLWTMFQRMLEGSGEVCCILDGLDECRNPVRERKSFFSQLTKSFLLRSDTARLVVISRLDPAELGEDISRWECVQIRPSDVRGDIEKFAMSEIRRIRALKGHPKKQHILDVLVDSSNGMILWTALMIKELEERPWDAEGVLKEPPQGLSEIYTVILDRIAKTASVRRIQRVLQLVLAASRPLRLEEFALGLAAMEGLRCHEDYDSLDPTTEGRATVRSSQPLLTIMPDETVELSHSSLRDYLFGAVTQSDIPAFRFQEYDVHYMMAKTALSYLSFGCFGAELSNREHHHYYFLEYSSRWLVYHSSKSGDSKEIAEKLVTFFKTVHGWRWLQRLSDIYKISHGHLQLMQSQLRLWGHTLDLNRESQDILSGFLLFLASKRYEETKLQLVEHSSILQATASLALTYSNQGRWKEAEDLQVELLGKTKRALGPVHPDTLTSMANLASTYCDQGRWKEAEKLEVEVLEMRKKVLGQEHLDTLISMANLASTYGDQGRWKEAEGLGVEILEKRKRVLGLEHPDTLISMANLASMYRDQGRWKEAEELGVGVLEMRKKVLGSEHPETLTSMANLASTYQVQGRWREAEKLEVEVLEMEKRVLGPEHPDTLTSMHNLALTYSNQGRWKEAEELQVEALGMTKRAFESIHPDTLTTMSNLALTYCDQGRWKEAEELQVEVLEMMKKAFGPEHPDTLASVANLASVYQDQGRWNEAEELEVEVLETRKRVLGPEHPDTLTSMANLASTYRGQGRKKGTEELEVEVLEMSKKVLGPEHPDTLISMANLASAYCDQGRWKEAEELKVEVLATRRRVLGPEHPDTLASMNNLASTYYDQGRWKEAEELGVEVLKIRKRVLGPEHPDTLTSMAHIASAYRGQGQWKEAEKLEVEVLEMRKGVLGPEHPDTLISMRNLAYALKSQDRDKEAIGLMKQAERLQRERLGSDHPSTMESAQALYEWQIPQEAAQTVAAGDALNYSQLGDFLDSEE